MLVSFELTCFPSPFTNVVTWDRCGMYGSHLHSETAFDDSHDSFLSLGQSKTLGRASRLATPSPNSTKRGVSTTVVVPSSHSVDQTFILPSSHARIMHPIHPIKVFLDVIIKLGLFNLEEGATYNNSGSFRFICWSIRMHSNWCCKHVELFEHWLARGRH